jgi:hypothetical protein
MQNNIFERDAALHSPPQDERYAKIIFMNDKKLEEALVRLINNPDGEFVIASDSLSNKFIQFAGSSNESLIVDLPIQTLGPDEIKRAARLFSEYGIKHERWAALDKPGGKPVGIQAGFNLKVGNDIKKAVEIAMRVFKEVYKVPDNFSLNIEEA